MKRGNAVEFDNTDTQVAIRRLLGDMSCDELEQVAIEVIKEHRRRLEHAQDLFERLEGRSKPGSELTQLQRDYRIARLNLHAQHQLVRFVVDALGYIPAVDGSAASSPSVPK